MMNADHRTGAVAAALAAGEDATAAAARAVLAAGLDPAAVVVALARHVDHAPVVRAVFVEAERAAPAYAARPGRTGQPIGMRPRIARTMSKRTDGRCGGPPFGRVST